MNPDLVQDWDRLIKDITIDSDQMKLDFNNGQAGGLTSPALTISHSSSAPYVNGTWSTIEPGRFGNGNLQVKGDADFEGDIRLRGRSLRETLDRIEQRLGIVTPRPDLEAEYEELRDLGDRYRALERSILDKQAVWAALKRSDNPKKL